MIAGMCAFKWQLLVMVEPVREKRMIGRHCYLHRLDEAPKLFNALEHFLHTGQVEAALRDIVPSFSWLPGLIH